MAVLNAHLTNEEFEALREVSNGPAQRTILVPHKNRLFQLDFICDGIEGLGLTNLGRSRFGQGK
jgi:hypothetical protein